MTIESFEEFTDALRAAGLRGVNDAQHERVRGVYDTFVQQRHYAEVSAEYWKLLAERNKEKP